MASIARKYVWQQHGEMLHCCVSSAAVLCSSVAGRCASACQCASLCLFSNRCVLTATVCTCSTWETRGLQCCTVGHRTTIKQPKVVANVATGTQEPKLEGPHRLGRKEASRRRQAPGTTAITHHNRHHLLHPGPTSPRRQHPQIPQGLMHHAHHSKVNTQHRKQSLPRLTSKCALASPKPPSTFPRERSSHPPHRLARHAHYASIHVTHTLRMYTLHAPMRNICFQLAGVGAMCSGCPVPCWARRRGYQDQPG